jgi:hypothetical protein
MLAVLQDQLPAGLDERRKWVWFKALKWVLHITYRLFNRWAFCRNVDNWNMRDSPGTTMLAGRRVAFDPADAATTAAMSSAFV